MNIGGKDRMPSQRAIPDTGWTPTECNKRAAGTVTESQSETAASVSAPASEIS